MTDYSKSKYQDATAEWAYSEIVNGNADESAGSVQSGSAWDLVTLHPADDETADAIEAENAATAAGVLYGSRVIIRTDDQGFVWVHYGPAHPLGDPPAYRALMAEWARILEDEGSELE